MKELEVEKRISEREKNKKCRENKSRECHKVRDKKETV